MPDFEKRERFCGRWTLQGVAVDGSHSKYNRVHCRCWDCKRCGPKKASRYKHQIRAKAEDLKLRRFLTLTLDPAKLGGELPVPYLRDCWNKFRTYLKRKYGDSPQYIAVLEFQKNGNPHLHVLIDRFIEQRWISETWQRIGGGRMVDIRLVDLHHVSRYLSKYLTKELLCSAPKRSRRITTSRGIHLNERQAPAHLWRIWKTTISYFFERLGACARTLALDEHGEIESFEVNLLNLAPA